MKIKVEDERYFPTLGVVAKPGDEVDVPVEAFPAKTVVDSKPSKTAKDETVVNNGSAPQ